MEGCGGMKQVEVEISNDSDDCVGGGGDMINDKL